MHRLPRVHEIGFFHPQDAHHHGYKEVQYLKQVILLSNAHGNFKVQHRKIV